MQKDLDKFLMEYNMKRSHQGGNMKGMTPWQAFKKWLPGDLKSVNKKEVKLAA